MAEAKAPTAATANGSGGAASSGGIRYEPFATLKGHVRAVAAVKFSPNGEYLASACEYPHPLLPALLLPNRV